MSSNLWRVLDKAWNFKLPPFTFGFFSRRSYSLSLGCWLHIASQESQNHGTPLATDEAKIQYLPLETSEIRLFVLCPGSDAEVISGRIEHSTWGWRSNKSYEALSYVWGDIRDSDTILVDGCTVSVTRSLETALRHLRYPDKPRTLWVDYVCINQKDVLERSQQVAKMGSIYEQASSVVIWLGLATLNSGVGMEILRYFANEKRPQPCPVWQTYPRSLVYQGLQDVMTRPWFERMWVVQEVGRSRRARLFCGRDFIEWRSDVIAVRCFIRMIKYAEILPEWTQLGLDAVNMRPLLEMLDFQDANAVSKPWGSCNRAAPDLLDLAYNMRHKKCTDPRDKIFGIWGLVDYLYDLEDFKLDYGMTVEQVYEEVARVSFH
ncbi:HET-domain-containing protein [Stipitochalara longipes BDJ]|nr:HET-domain-containing protein [Stipitochalara longipes BDJ]